MFLVSALLGGVLEQLTGWAMSELFDAESWTYLHLPDHITQWVAWRFVAMWGLLGLVWSRAVMPRLLYQIGNAFERWVDTNYSDEFISARFQNLKIGGERDLVDENGNLVLDENGNTMTEAEGGAR